MTQGIHPEGEPSRQGPLPWRALSAMAVLSPIILLEGLPAVDVPSHLWPPMFTEILRAIGAAGILGLAAWTAAAIGPRLSSRSRTRHAGPDPRADHGEVAHLRQEAQLTRELIDSAVHELASPLTSMGFQLHALRTSAADRLEDDEVALLKRTIEDLGRFKRLVSDLRDSTRAHGGRLDLETQPLDLGQLVEQQVERHQQEAGNHDVALAVHVEATPRLEGDPDRLAQILSNLLSNAVAYTPSGGRVGVVVDQTDELASVQVSDTGIGLEEEDLSRIFEPYARAHQAVEGIKDGTGLGLPIARRLAEAHGGQVTAQSPGRGQGSTFTLTLPLAPPTGTTDGPDGAGDGPTR